MTAEHRDTGNYDYESLERTLPLIQHLEETLPEIPEFSKEVARDYVAHEVSLDISYTRKNNRFTITRTSLGFRIEKISSNDLGEVVKKQKIEAEANAYNGRVVYLEEVPGEEDVFFVNNDQAAAKAKEFIENLNR